MAWSDDDSGSELMGLHAPIVRLTSSGPMQYTTLLRQITHARHHTIASPMMHCNRKPT